MLLKTNFKLHLICCLISRLASRPVASAQQTVRQLLGRRQADGRTLRERQVHCVTLLHLQQSDVSWVRKRFAQHEQRENILNLHHDGRRFVFNYSVYY